MKKGIMIILISIIVGLCSMGAWIVDGSLFAITGGIAMICMVFMMLGLITYIVETNSVKKRHNR